MAGRPGTDTRGVSGSVPSALAPLSEQVSALLAAEPAVAFPQTVIALQRPELPPAGAVLEYFRLATDARFFSNGGPCLRLLTERLERYLGDGVHAIPVANCTLGLMVALRGACGAPEGCRRTILTPAYTFTATACAIEWAGFEPYFVDVEPDGWHMDPEALECALAAVGDDVAGVLACSTFGTPPPPSQRAAWRSSCAGRGVPLLVDSAPGFGASDEHGIRLGAQEETEVFSFHATKPFAVGEGGLVVTRDPAVAERIERLINFGLEPGSRTSLEIGLNAKMSELHAATALAMLDRIESVLHRRRGNALRLRSALAGLPVAYQRGAERSTWQIFHVLAADPAARTRALELAPIHSVQVRTMHAPPLHRHPAFAARGRGDLTTTELLSGRALALPMANDLPGTAIERIAALVAEASG
jgi:dTDP-4-amino-4,6-dideoxygalactose transaminase